MPFFYPSTPLTLSGKTLVVPCVSTANVSQLAIDLLIASLSLRRVGTFDPVDLVPVVGAREDGEEGVMTPLELFGLEDIDILVVHQRSPVLRSRKAEFIDSLLTFITESEFAAVLFLSGIDLSNRTDAQMPTPDYHIIPPNAPALHSTPLGNLHSLVPTYTSPLSISEIPAAERTDIPYIPGGGLTRRLLSSLPPSWSVPTAALVRFVNEGDNTTDATEFADTVAKVLGIESQMVKGKRPSSWTHGLFGTPHDQTLF